MQNLKMIDAVNVRWTQEPDRFHYVNIMRPNILGNPFPMQKFTVSGKADPAERKRVIEKFKKYLWKEMQTSESKVRKELFRILELSRVKPVRLVCCCKPLDCHGDVIVAAIEWMNETTFGALMCTACEGQHAPYGCDPEICRNAGRPVHLPVNN